MSFTTKHRDDLEERGYTVIENAVLEYKTYKAAVFDWIDETFVNGELPRNDDSIVRNYSVGHTTAAWSTRLSVKKLFEILWGTDQLLTSFDGVAISEPPEKGHEDFDSGNEHNLHVDQGSARLGLHAYQGAVYLETADEDDWTFEVLEGSHEHLSEFYDQNEKAKILSFGSNSWGLQQQDVKWFKSFGCKQKRVPVKAGGLLLWDSRLVHGSVRPLKGRRHPERWRVVVFVCMTPVAWSTREDIAKKREAYNKLCLTTHWPSDDVRLMGPLKPFDPKSPQNLNKIRKHVKPTLPEVAKNQIARRLAGVTPYAPAKGSRDVAWRPHWDATLRPDMAAKTKTLYRGESKRLRALMFISLAIFVSLLFLYKW